MEEPNLPFSSTSQLTCLPSCIFLSSFIQFLVYTMAQPPLDKYVRGWRRGRRHCTDCSVSVTPMSGVWVCHPSGQTGRGRTTTLEGGAWAWWKARLERQLGKFAGVRNTAGTKNNSALGEKTLIDTKRNFCWFLDHYLLYKFSEEAHHKRGIISRQIDVHSYIFNKLPQLLYGELILLEKCPFWYIILHYSNWEEYFIYLKG